MYMQQAYSTVPSLVARLSSAIKIQHPKGAKALRKSSVARPTQLPSNADNRQLITRVEYM